MQDGTDDKFYTETLGIDPKRCYTIREIMQICGTPGNPKSLRAVKDWVYVGLRSPGNGIVSLKTHWIGGRIAIIGADLIDFLRNSGQNRAER